jgi:hypothetical protein
MTRLLAVLGHQSSEELPTGTPPEILPTRKSTKTGETKTRNGEGNGFTTHISHYVLSASEKHGHDSLHAERRIREKAYLVTMDTGAPSTIACPESHWIALERLPTQCALQTASGKTLPILK